jgi:outer membrane lipoprotein-sorting protein
MKILSGFALGFALLLAAPSASAQVHAAVLSDSDQAVLGQVQAYLNGLRTLKARFIQTAQDGKTTTGTMWLERPGRMRFEYDKPSPLLLVAGHGVAIFRDNQLDQTNTLPLTQTPLGLLLADTITLTGPVTVTQFQRLPGLLRMTMVRTAQPGDGSLSLELTASPIGLVGWTVVDAEGRETHIQLTGVTQGGSFDPSLFTFTDPDAAGGTQTP